MVKFSFELLNTIVISCMDAFENAGSDKIFTDSLIYQLDCTKYTIDFRLNTCKNTKLRYILTPQIFMIEITFLKYIFG